ncbi:MAG: hypothetical protein FJ390_02840 [Verrucomicrobia bacterium]|nr:hypothetical protein [Verrucomicrobiota bacterium]
MISPTTPSPFKKKPTSLAEELSTYQDLARAAEEKGNQKLADRWHLAAELIIGFVEYLNYSRQLSFIQKFTEQSSINEQAIEVQEIAQYTTSSLTALMNGDISLAQELTSYAQETTEAGIRCRHWLTVIKNEIATHHTTQELSFDKAAAEYRANALKATQEGKNIIAQHWAEAACLAQEASRKKGFSISAYVTSGNAFLSSHWSRSRDASYDAAKLKVEVALALEQNQYELAQEYDNLALAAEKLSLYRENLVRSMINGEIAAIPHWRNAAEFLSKSLEVKLALKNTLVEEPLLSYQKAIITAAEEAAESHSELIPKLKKKKKPSLMPINFSEKSYQEAVKALQWFQTDNLPSAAKAKERAHLYSNASQLSKKVAHAKTQWYTLGIPLLYWMYRVKKVESLLNQ